MKGHIFGLGAVLVGLATIFATPALAQTPPGGAFLAEMTPEGVTLDDATFASDEGTCRAFNTSPYPVESDASGMAVLDFVRSGGEWAIHYTVTVRQSAGIDQVFLAIGSPNDTWCDGRKRHYLYGPPGLGAPVDPVTNGLVATGLLVQDDGTGSTSDLSTFASFPGAGDGFDNFVDALLDGDVFIVARVNSLGLYFRGETRGQLERAGN